MGTRKLYLHHCVAIGISLAYKAGGWEAAAFLGLSLLYDTVYRKFFERLIERFEWFYFRSLARFITRGEILSLHR